MTLKPGGKAIKGRPRSYKNPSKMAWLSTCTAASMTVGLVFLKQQAVWASAVMATPKKGEYGLASDYRQMNKMVGNVPGPMLHQEVE